MGVGVGWVGDHFAGVQVRFNVVGWLCSGAASSEWSGVR